VSVQESSSVASQANQLPHVQPMIVVQGDCDTGLCNSFSIICEAVVCTAGASVVESLDILLKFFWIFRMEYPRGLQVMIIIMCV